MTFLFYILYRDILSVFFHQSHNALTEKTKYIFSLNFIIKLLFNYVFIEIFCSLIMFRTDHL